MFFNKGLLNQTSLFWSPFFMGALRPGCRTEGKTTTNHQTWQMLFASRFRPAWDQRLSTQSSTLQSLFGAMRHYLANTHTHTGQMAKAVWMFLHWTHHPICHFSLLSPSKAPQLSISLLSVGWAGVLIAYLLQKRMFARSGAMLTKGTILKSKMWTGCRSPMFWMCAATSILLRCWHTANSEKCASLGRKLCSVSMPLEF